MLGRASSYIYSATIENKSLASYKTSGALCTSVDATISKNLCLLVIERKVCHFTLFSSTSKLGPTTELG